MKAKLTDKERKVAKLLKQKRWTFSALAKKLKLDESTCRGLVNNIKNKYPTKIREGIEFKCIKWFKWRK